MSPLRLTQAQLDQVMLTATPIPLDESAARAEITLGGDTQLLLDVGHHRVRQARLAEFREVFSDGALP